MKTVQALINAAIIYAYFAIIKLTQCSNIFAELDVVRYCTDQRTLCQNTGSFIHIACEYYGKVGSACSKFKDVPLEESDEDTILHRINSMRSQAAFGKAIGKDEQKLPRAYGMKQVFWDGELAAFAKIMINQCIDKHRYSCAASKTFTSPLMAYMSANTTGSAAEIIDNILSSWEADALATTEDEILHSPDLKGEESRFYIKTVMGDVTHIGCATGVYEHEIRPFAVKPSDNIRLSGHMVCYLSHYSRPDTPVYNTTEPVNGTGWTECGCPPMYRETEDCLCVNHTIEHTDLDNRLFWTKAAINTRPKKKMQLLDATDLKLKMTKQPAEETSNENPEFRQKLEWSPKETLESNMQHMLEPQIQQKLKETQSALGVGAPTPCAGGGRCDPKIIMLPVLTIENTPKLFNRRNSRGFGGYFRRSGSNCSVPTTKEIDDVSFTVYNIDELSKNMSLRSKVLETMGKIRQKQAADLFSKEKKELKLNIERSTVEPIERRETTKRSVEPTKLIERVHDEPTEKPYKSVLNLLKLLEEQGKIGEPLQSITEPSDPITTRNDGKEKAKRKVMNLLNLLERNGNQALLSSREFIDFDTKMRKIYKSVIKTSREGNLIKSRDTYSLFM